MFDGFEDVSDGAGHNSSECRVAVVLAVYSLHGEGLPCACLAICEDSAIVSLEDALDDGEGGLFEDGLLVAVGGKGGIVGEVSGGESSVLLWVGVLHYDLPGLLIHTYDDFMVGLALLGGGGTASHYHFHCLSLGTDGLGCHFQILSPKLTSINSRPTQIDSLHS